MLRYEEIPEQALIAKRQIEIYYRDFFMRFQERSRVGAKIDYGARVGKYDESTRLRLRHEQFLRELEFIRRRRKPLNMSDFHTVRKIGQGSYGEVFLVRLKTSNQLFAMKKLLKRDMVKRRQVNHVWLERFVLATVGEHPYVVKMYFSFQDSDYLYLVMEYLPGGDLLSMLIRHGSIPENWARFYIAELIVAIDALHRTGIIHRDIKPDNVLFGRTGHVCLSDFGLSKFVLGHLQSTPAGPANAPNFIESVRRGDLDLTHAERKAAWKALARNRVFSAVGTPSYIAPEVLNSTSYTESCDWWSVGAILYEMLVGVPPFIGNSPVETIDMIRNWRHFFDFPDWPASRLSLEARDLIGRLLCDASVRLGGREGLEEFKVHPFFAGVNWDNLAQQKAPFVPDLKDDDDTRYFDDDIPNAPYGTSNVNTSSNSSNDVTNTSGSNGGSHETAIATSSSAAQSNLGSRRSSTNRRPSRSSRLRDLDFLGFTYMPIHTGADRRLGWQNEFNRATPSSAPPRTSNFAERINATSRSGPSQSNTSADQAPPQRSRSVGTNAPVRQQLASSQSRQRTSIGGRNAPPLPPHRRPSTDAPRTQNDDSSVTDESVRLFGMPSITEETSNLPSGSSSTKYPPRLEASTNPADLSRGIRGAVVGLLEPVPSNSARNVASTKRRERTRNTSAEDESDSIVAGLDAITVTELYPRRTTSASAGGAQASGSEPVDGASDVGSTMTPDLQPLPEPEGVTLSSIIQPSSAAKPDTPEQVSTQGRAHKSSLVPNAEVSDEPRIQPLDADALEDQSIEVPSTSDVVNFVMDAVEELEGAAAELDEQTGVAMDIESVIRNAASDLNGTALELHRNLSESN